MADPFVAEIRIFPFSFAPTGWAHCAGQIMPISQNTALFSLLGTTYGGDGKSTFALPDLEGSAPMHIGYNQPGPGLSVHDLGEQSGVEYVTLINSEMPVHTHTVQASDLDADQLVPNPNRLFATSVNVFAYQHNAVNLTLMAPQTLAPAGGSLPHNNMQPYLTLNFCIALQGVFPARP
jgi:microcystin-dependent protein